MNIKDTFNHIDHRPWPVPTSPWIMCQTWRDLLFAHWPIAPDVLRAAIPEPLTVDTFNRQGWLGIVPFRMSGVSPRYLPDVLGLSAFPELNVRTYVTHSGKPGVYFFSLDAANPIAVAVARRWFHLPYFNASMSLREDGEGWIHYDSRRTHHNTPPAEFRGRYRATGPVALAAEGTLDQWLTERYALYTFGGRGRLLRAEIHHVQWPLQPAEAEIEVNTTASAHGLALPDIPPLLHFARRLDVPVWPLRPVEE